jgi:hypothetical protein
MISLSLLPSSFFPASTRAIQGTQPVNNASTGFGPCVRGLGNVAWLLFDRLEQSAIAARATASEQVV